MSRTLNELLDSHDDQWDGTVRAGGGTASLDHLEHVRWSDLRRVESLDELAQAALVVLSVGPDAGRHGSLDELAAALAGAAAGTSVLVLSAWAPAELAAGPAPTVLANARLSPVDATTTGDQAFPVGLLAEVSEQAGSADALRTAILSLDPGQDPVAEDQQEDLDTRSALPSRDLEARLAMLTRERSELAARLRAAEVARNAAERQVDALQRSTSLQIGQAVVDAVKRPRTALALPRKAFRTWRARGGRKGVSQVRRREGVAAVSVDETSRLVEHLGGDLAPRSRPVLLGVLSPTAAARLGAAASVSTAVPHELVPALERLRPDAVIVQTAAGGPASPWAHLGDAAAPERERRLLAALEVARMDGVPFVLWRDSPPQMTASLDDFAAACDAVLDGPTALHGGAVWTPGADLRGCVGQLGSRGRDGSVLHLGTPDPRDTAARRAQLLRAFAAAGERLVIVPDDERDLALLPPELRARALGRTAAAQRRALLGPASVVIASPLSVPAGVVGLHDTMLEALAAGARLVSGPNSDLAALAGRGAALHVVDAGSVEDAVREAAERGAATPEEHLAALRLLFDEASAPPRLAELGRRLGLPWDARAGRSVSAVLRDAAAAIAAVDGLLAQSLRPSEVVLGPQVQLDGRARDALAAAGIGIVVLHGRDGGWQRIAAACAGDWVLDVADAGALARPGYVRDLVLAAEAADADGVVPCARILDRATPDDPDVALGRPRAWQQHTTADARAWLDSGDRVVTVPAGSQEDPR